MLRAEFVVKLLGDALNVQRLAKALGHFDDGYITRRIEFADLEDQGAELAQEEIAGLVDLKIVIAGVGLTFITFDPIPKALRPVPIDEIGRASWRGGMKDLPGAR